nr:hypothetical protein [Geofilum rhodophaeum]
MKNQFAMVEAFLVVVDKKYLIDGLNVLVESLEIFCIQRYKQIAKL